jgi:chemotaxis protein CheD
MRVQNVIGIGQLGICRPPEQLACLGLGSCVAVILYDPFLRLGGIVHVLLPKAPANSDGSEEKYADTGTRKLVKELMSRGATKERMVAKLVGGAQMFSNLNLAFSDIGKNNIAEVKKVLRELGIRVVAQDVEGNKGRSVYLDPETGKVVVETAFSPSRTF